MISFLWSCKAFSKVSILLYMSIAIANNISISVCKRTSKCFILAQFVNFSICSWILAAVRCGSLTRQLRIFPFCVETSRWFLIDTEIGACQLCRAFSLILFFIFRCLYVQISSGDAFSVFGIYPALVKGATLLYGRQAVFCCQTLCHNL